MFPVCYDRNSLLNSTPMPKAGADFSQSQKLFLYVSILEVTS